MVVFNVRQSDTQKKTELIDLANRYPGTTIGHAGREDLFYIECPYKSKKFLQTEIKDKKLGELC